MQPSYLDLHSTGELVTRAQAAAQLLADCRLCPRQCGVNRQADEEGDGAGYDGKRLWIDCIPINPRPDFFSRPACCNSSNVASRMPLINLPLLSVL